jgi:hypothetical protein
MRQHTQQEIEHMLQEMGISSEKERQYFLQMAKVDPLSEAAAGIPIIDVSSTDVLMKE